MERWADESKVAGKGSTSRSRVPRECASASWPAARWLQEHDWIKVECFRYGVKPPPESGEPESSRRTQMSSEILNNALK